MEFIRKLFPVSWILKDYCEIMNLMIESRICLGKNVVDNHELILYVNLGIINECIRSISTTSSYCDDLLSIAKDLSKKIYPHIYEQIAILTLNLIATNEYIELTTNQNQSLLSNPLYYLSIKKRLEVAKNVLAFTGNIIYGYRKRLCHTHTNHSQHQSPPLTKLQTLSF